MPISSETQFVKQSKPDREYAYSVCAAEGRLRHAHLIYHFFLRPQEFKDFFGEWAITIPGKEKGRQRNGFSIAFSVHKCDPVSEGNHTTRN